MIEYKTPGYEARDYLVEHALFDRSPDWELDCVERALSLMRFMNTPVQEARLAAVKTIKRERAARRRVER